MRNNTSSLLILSSVLSFLILIGVITYQQTIITSFSQSSDQAVLGEVDEPCRTGVQRLVLGAICPANTSSNSDQTNYNGATITCHDGLSTKVSGCNTKSYFNSFAAERCRNASSCSKNPLENSANSIPCQQIQNLTAQYCNNSNFDPIMPSPVPSTVRPNITNIPSVPTNTLVPTRYLRPTTRSVSPTRVYYPPTRVAPRVID